MTLASLPNVQKSYGEIPAALHGSTILITGAAGLVGTQLLYRLLCDSGFSTSIDRVIAIIRGTTAEDALKRLPTALRVFARPHSQAISGPKLIVLNGDCARPDFGLDPAQQGVARQADIVINAAADTRFMLPLADAISGVVRSTTGVIGHVWAHPEKANSGGWLRAREQTDIAYMVSRFCLTTPGVKTYIHLSTTFVGWIMKDQSVVYEDFDCRQPLDGGEEHANTYLQAKALGENCVNSLFQQQQFGQLRHRKAVRILRLATLGGAVEFPRAGWGSGWQSSPISAILATESIPRESLQTLLPENAVLDGTSPLAHPTRACTGAPALKLRAAAD